MCFHFSLNVFRLKTITQINHQSVTTIGLHQSSKSSPLMTLTYKNHEDFNKVVMWLGIDSMVRITFGHMVLRFGIKIKSHKHNAINKYHSQYITFQLIFQLTHTLLNHILEHSIKHKIPILYCIAVFFT